jgi:hypothetical protein
MPVRFGEEGEEMLPRLTKAYYSGDIESMEVVQVLGTPEELIGFEWLHGYPGWVVVLRKASGQTFAVSENLLVPLPAAPPSRLDEVLARLEASICELRAGPDDERGQRLDGVAFLCGESMDTAAQEWSALTGRKWERYVD